MFGTFEPEAERVRYGLTKNIEHATTRSSVAFHEYAAIVRDLRTTRALRDRLGYLLGPPGWQPRPPRRRGTSPAAVAGRW